MAEIEVIECNTITEAELEYLNRRGQGCWQMVKAVKPIFSWKKMKTVFRFEMKKVEKAYHFEDYMKDMNKAITFGCKVAVSLSRTMSEIKSRRKIMELEAKFNPQK